MSQKVAYLISAVAKMLDIHPQTLRQYEKEGLVEPSRSDGKMRLYSAEDIERVREVLRLTRQMGVNLAGAKLILELHIIIPLTPKQTELERLSFQFLESLVF